jgi:hypothetical protein
LQLPVTAASIFSLPSSTALMAYIRVHARNPLLIQAQINMWPLYMRTHAPVHKHSFSDPPQTVRNFLREPWSLHPLPGAHPVLGKAGCLCS